MKKKVENRVKSLAKSRKRKRTRRKRRERPRNECRTPKISEKPVTFVWNKKVRTKVNFPKLLFKGFLAQKSTNYR